MSLALLNSPDKAASLPVIISFIRQYFPYYRYTKVPWQHLIKTALQHRSVWINHRHVIPSLVSTYM